MNEYGPGRLVTAAADDNDNERVYLELSDGRKLPLPHHYRVEEFALPGNLEIHADGKLFAAYDETTRTGAILDAIGKIPYWTLIQPTTREVFFGEQVPGALESLAAQGFLPR